MTAILHDVAVGALYVTMFILLWMLNAECLVLGRWIGDRISDWIIRGPK
jgi:hypothetical protein